MLEFSATIEINGVNPYVRVSRAQAAALRPDWRRPMPVLVQINGKPEASWHINMMPIGDGDFYLYLHENVRSASSTAVGDTVTIKVAIDDEYVDGPQHPLPALFAEALAKDQGAYDNWANLAPSRQKEVLRTFAGLKSDEALQRNIQKALFVIAGNDGHYIGRDWSGGK